MIKLFEDFNESNAGIEAICKEYGIIGYWINPDGIVDVEGDVNLYESMLFELPFKFGRVSGDFDCSENRLTSLKGAPSYVGGLFDCHSNKLTTLEGAPSYVGGEFYCSYNSLRTLEFCPKYVGDYFVCEDNELTTLKYVPTQVGGEISFRDNPLPQPILNIMDDINSIKYIIENQDVYGIWNKDESFNEIRFNIMMREKDL